MVELVYKLTRSLPRLFEKVSRLLKCHSYFLGESYTYIYTLYIEHSIPHADGAPLHFTSLSYIFRMIMFYLLPMLAECGRGSISLQSSVIYQVETDQCKRSFESVSPDLPLFLLTSLR